MLPEVMRTSLSEIMMRSSSLISGWRQARFRCHRAWVTQSQVEAGSTGTGDRVITFLRENIFLLLMTLHKLSRNL